MTVTILHKAGDRFHVRNERADSYFSFSFGDLYREDRLGFGALRVLNDDVVSPGAGFGSHPHDNMEIITIMVNGEITHSDSLGNEGIARPGRLQIISAGSGIFHSEYNKGAALSANNLQIWVYPNQLNTPPGYRQADYVYPTPLNEWQVILEPLGAAAGDPATGQNAVTQENTGKLRQDAWFNLARISKGTSLRYPIKKAGNGVYIFVIEGRLTVEKETLGRRDGLGVSGDEAPEVFAEEDAEVLLMDIPMVNLL
ncbi:MAG: pirin family protein [Puia sp.]|nr:pirin family protein [Puia sp.]